VSKGPGTILGRNTVAGAGHGLSGAKPDKVAQIARQAAEYVKTHTG
jgi:hypothetical protein